MADGAPPAPGHNGVTTAPTRPLADRGFAPPATLSRPSDSADRLIGRRARLPVTHLSRVAGCTEHQTPFDFLRTDTGLVIAMQPNLAERLGLSGIDADADLTPEQQASPLPGRRLELVRGPRSQQIIAEGWGGGDGAAVRIFDFDPPGATIIPDHGEILEIPWEAVEATFSNAGRRPPT
jgi:hypothetical protein